MTDSLLQPDPDAPTPLRVLITGGTSGVGLGIAKAFASLGASLVICAIEENPHAVLTDLKQLHPQRHDPHYIRLDLSNSEHTSQAISSLTRTTPIDVLINNAGIQFTAPISDFPLDRWNTLLALHLTAPFLLMQKILPAMMTRGWGRVINIASAHGLVASPYKSGYVAAKHGLIGLTKTAALETANHNVTVNAICPGWVNTPLVNAQLQQRAQDSGISIEQATWQLLDEKHPAREFVSVESIAAVCLMLCSRAGRAFRGATLNPDCGWLAR